MKKALAVLSLLLVLCFTAASCSKSKSSYGTAATASKDGTKTAVAASTAKGNADIATDTAGTDDSSDSSDLSETANSGLDVRKLIKDVSLTIQTKTFDDFMSGLQNEIDQYGGYVQKSNIAGNSYTSSSNRSATVVAKIPADKLDGFLSLVSSSGNVVSKTENVQDVTSNYIDTESHISALKTEQDSLLKLLGKADNLSDILSIQDRLTSVRTELESYEKQLRTYDNLVAYSTVTMEIREVEQIKPAEKLGMWQEIGSNLTKNLTDIGHGFRSFFIWFVSALPYLLLIAVVVTAVILIIRKCAKKKIRNEKEPLPLFTPLDDDKNNSEPEE